MARIYLDSNVFSNLRNPKDDSHRLLKRLLENYHRNMSFHFSNAHIRDKKKDNSEFKFEDFKFMETLVQDNYLSYHPIKGHTSFYLATPQMAFEDESIDSIDDLLSFFDPNEKDEDLMDSLKNHLTSVLDMNEIKVEQTLIDSGIEKETIDKIFTGKEGTPSLLDISKNIAHLSRDIISDGLTYRNLRNLINNGFSGDMTKFKDNKFGLNEAFKDSFFQKTFVDFIKDSIHVENKTRIPYYNFYMLSYQVLDILGISKEKLKKNNGFGNILNDALHSYYARYCDILVTNDKGLMEKSSILYNMYEVSTLILTVEEFNELLPEIGLNTDETPEYFFKKLNYDIQNSKRTFHAYTEKGNEILRLDEISVYFNFFDVILEEILENSRRYILCKSDTSYLSEPNYRETERIINRLIILFGDDSEGSKEFVFERETLAGSKPIERRWDFGQILIHLGTEKLTSKFSLSITVLQN